MTALILRHASDARAKLTSLMQRWSRGEDAITLRTIDASLRLIEESASEPGPTWMERLFGPTLKSTSTPWTVKKVGPLIVTEFRIYLIEGSVERQYGAAFETRDKARCEGERVFGVGDFVECAK